ATYSEPSGRRQTQSPGVVAAPMTAPVAAPTAAPTAAPRPPPAMPPITAPVPAPTTPPAAARSWVRVQPATISAANRAAASIFMFMNFSFLAIRRARTDMDGNRDTFRRRSPAARNLGQHRPAN